MCRKWAPKTSKMEARTFLNRAEIAPRRRHDGKKNRKRSYAQQKTPFPQLAPPYFDRKSGQHGSKLGSQIEPKIDKALMQKTIEKVMHLGIGLWNDFNGFLDGKWRPVGTNIEQKSIPTSKSDFLKKPCFD